MLKSREVPLALLAALALSAAGCKDAAETRNCVDVQGHIVPDSNCRTGSTAVGYHYIYGGSSGGHVGDVVVGGKTTPSEEGVSRGGFGHGEGGGEGGGE
jgi:hypothetical protein